jgi:hypothetical protein
VERCAAGGTLVMKESSVVTTWAIGRWVVEEVDAEAMGSSSSGSLNQQIWDASKSLSPDLAIKHALTNISPGGLQLESTGTMPTVNVPTVEGYTTRRLNAQSLSHKRSIMRRVSRQILSQYLQSLKKAHPPLATTQSARSSPYLGGRGNLDPN